jgi:hypothetical protein
MNYTIKSLWEATLRLKLHFKTKYLGFHLGLLSLNLRRIFLNLGKNNFCGAFETDC